jgi:hypothetical protein
MAEAWGMVTVEAGKRDNNGQSSNIYTIRPCHEWDTSCPGGGGHAQARPRPGRGGHDHDDPFESELNLRIRKQIVTLTTEETSERTKGSGLPIQDLDPSDDFDPWGDRQTTEEDNPSEPDLFGMFSGEESGSREVNQEAPLDDEPWWPDQQRRNTKGRIAPLPESPSPIELEPFVMSLSGGGSRIGEVIHQASFIDELLEAFPD